MGATVATATRLDFARTDHLGPGSLLASSGYGAASPSRPDRAAYAAALGVGPELDQAVPRGDGLALGLIGAAQRGQACGKLDPHLGRLEGCTASLEAVQGIFQQRPGSLVVPSRGRQDSLGQI